MEHLSLKTQRLRNKSLAEGEALWVWEVSDWMNNNYSVPFFVTIAYVLFVYFGRKFMEKREAFELKWPLVLWNALLASKPNSLPYPYFTYF
jgi:hypothetical protein